MQLTSNDATVLQALFDSELSSSNGVQTESSVPPLPGISHSELRKLQDLERSAISSIQVSEEDGTVQQPAVETAISKLSDIIDNNPNYPSAYINRAQAYRLLIESRQNDIALSNQSSNRSEISCSNELSEQASKLFTDFARAISLLKHAITTPISPFHSHLLSTAYTHRAYLLYEASRTSRSSPQPNFSAKYLLPLDLRELPSERLEDMASGDFAIAGRYGSTVARQMAVKTNPYAKVCGQIVREAMSEEMREVNKGFIGF